MLTFIVWFWFANPLYPGGNQHFILFKCLQGASCYFVIWGRSQTTFADFWLFLPPPPWLTALHNKICDFYLVILEQYPDSGEDISENMAQYAEK